MSSPRSQVRVSFIPEHQLEPESTQTQLRGRAVLWGLLLLTLVVAVYGRTIRFGFIHTDRQTISHNLTLRTWGAGLHAIWLRPAATPQYSPLAYSALLVENKLSRGRAAGFHAASVMIHALNVLLLWTLLRRLHLPGAVFAAAIFAIHPVQLEAVAWISQQRILLCTTFYLFGLLFYLRSTGETTAPWRWYALTVICAAAAMLCHGFGVTFPLVAAVLAPRHWPKLVPILGIGIAVLFLMGLGEKRAQPAAFSSDWVLTLGRYLWHVLWPWGVGSLSDHAMYPLLAVICGGIAIVVARLGARPLVLATQTLLIALLGVLTFARLPVMRNDLSLWTHVLDRNPDSIPALNAMGLIELNERNSPQKAIAHFTRALAADPRNPQTLLNLANAQLAAGDFDKSVNQYRQVLARDADNADANLGLGMAFEQQNRATEALEQYTEALRLRPDSALGHLRIGQLYADLGDTKNAIEHMQTAIRLAPQDSVGYILLAAVVFNHLQDEAGAETLLLQARRLDLRNPDTVMVAGNILFELGKNKPPAQRGETFARAVWFFREAVRLSPHRAVAHKNLGIALGAQAQWAQQAQEALDCLNEAIFCFERAMSLDPSDPQLPAFRAKATADRDEIARRIR